jgi:hypothetical protein
LARNTNISPRSLNRAQLDAILEGPKQPVISYVTPNSVILVTLSTLVEMARFPVLGLKFFSIEMEASYPPGVPNNELSQLQYELVAYKDSASQVMLRSGAVSPFYDRLEDNFRINHESVALFLSTPNLGTSIPRGITATFSVQAMP